MTGLRPPWPDPGALDRRQREFELYQALIAARKLQERLEMLGDRATDVRVVQSLRNSLADDLASMPLVEVPRG
jgi:hypothetical protein